MSSKYVVLLSITKKVRIKAQKSYAYIISHLRGMSWYSSFGNVRRIVIGRVPDFSSTSAISIGPARVFGGSTRIGAPIAICKALAPTIRARSKRVSLAGPIVTSFCSVVCLIRSCTRRHSHASHTSHSAHSTAWWHWRCFHFS